MFTVAKVMFSTVKIYMSISFTKSEDNKGDMKTSSGSITVSAQQHQETAAGKGRSAMTKLCRTWASLTDKLLNYQPFHKNPGDSDHDPGSIDGDGSLGAVTMATTEGQVKCRGQMLDIDDK